MMGCAGACRWSPMQPTTCGRLEAKQLVVDVLGPPRVATAALAAAAGHAESASCVPFLLVRYLHAPASGAPLKACREAFRGARPGQCSYLDVAIRESSCERSAAAAEVDGSMASERRSTPRRLPSMPRSRLLMMRLRRNSSKRGRIAT